MRSDPTSARLPWASTDSGLLAAANAVGALAIGLAWIGGSGTVRVDTQLSWLQLGIAGSVIAATGNAWFLLSGLHSIAGRRQRFETREPSRPLAAGRIAALELGPPTAASDDDFVADSVMTRFHRPTCPAACGRDVRAQTLDAHLAAGRRACGICIAQTPGPT